MPRWQSFWLNAALVLLLSACSWQGGGQIVVAQATPLPTVTQHPAPAATDEATVVPTPSVSASSEKVSDDPPDSCPVTQPPDPPFTPPPPYPPTSPRSADEFWYGTAALWTRLGIDGTWRRLPHHGTGYVQKIAWWREGYDIPAEPQPNLTVTGWRLDAPAGPLRSSRATNAYLPYLKSAMLIGVTIPTLGCWEITGHYEGHELSFVVWVAP